MTPLAWIATVLGGVTVTLLAWMATTFSTMSADMKAMAVEIAAIKAQMAEIKAEAKEQRTAYATKSEYTAFATLVFSRIDDVCRRLSLVEGN